MRSLRFTLWFMAIGLLSSCMSDSDLESVPDTSTEKVEVSVGVTSADSFTTKSVGDLDKNTGNVDSVQIYVFRESGDLDAFSAGKNDEDIIIKVTKGTREFFAVANAQGAFNGITKKDVFLKTVSELENEKSGKFTMVGTAGVKVVENATNIQIVVARLVSRIQLQYNVNFKGTAWEGKKFIPDSIYITNAHSRATVNSCLGTDAATDFVSGGWTSTVNSALLDKAEASWGETPAPIGGDKWVSYYVYKNDRPASDKFKDVTSLVICGRIEGSNDIEYYRVSINTPKSNITGGDEDAKYKYVQNNVIYGVKATIKGKGTPDPGVDPINFHVTVVPKHWTEIWQEVEFE